MSNGPGQLLFAEEAELVIIVLDALTGITSLNTGSAENVAGQKAIVMINKLDIADDLWWEAMKEQAAVPREHAGSRRFGGRRYGMDDLGPG